MKLPTEHISNHFQRAELHVPSVFITKGIAYLSPESFCPVLFTPQNVLAELEPRELVVWADVHTAGVKTLANKTNAETVNLTYLTQEYNECKRPWT